MGGSALQHRIPRTALYRGPAAPRHADIVATLGFVVLVFPQPALGQSGRRNPLLR